MKHIIGADNICPMTKKPCDDETCSPGSECNLSDFESIPFSEPAKESRPDEQWNRESARAAAKEAYKSFAGLPSEFDDWFDSEYPPSLQPEPSEEQKDFWNWFAAHYRAAIMSHDQAGHPAEAAYWDGYHDAMNAIEKAAPEDISARPSPPSVKPERERWKWSDFIDDKISTEKEYLPRPSPFLEWVDAEDDLPTKQNEEYHLQYRTNEGWAPMIGFFDNDAKQFYVVERNCNITYLSLKEFPGLQWLKETASPRLLADLDKMASSSTPGKQVEERFYCMYNKFTGDCAVQCGHCKAMSSRPSPTPPAVQQEDGEVDANIEIWLSELLEEEFSYVDDEIANIAIAAKRNAAQRYAMAMYHKMQEDVVLLRQEFDERLKLQIQLEAQLATLRQEKEDYVKHLWEMKAEAIQNVSLFKDADTDDEISELRYWYGKQCAYEEAISKYTPQNPTNNA